VSTARRPSFHFFTKTVAAAALVSVAPRVWGAPLVAFERILSEPLEARVTQLRRLEPRMRATFVGLAFDPKEPLTTRWRAVTTMGRLDHTYFTAPIERALRSPEWFMRNAALIASLNLTRAPAEAAAMRALDDPALVVRTQAVRNLIHLKARASEPKLWRMLNDARSFTPRGESLWIRAHVVEALSGFATPTRTAAFKRLLLDEDPRVHRWAVRGLETSVGTRLTAPDAPVESARRRWLAQLGDGTI